MRESFDGEECGSLDLGKDYKVIQADFEALKIKKAGPGIEGRRSPVKPMRHDRQAVPLPGSEVSLPVSSGSPGSAAVRESSCWGMSNWNMKALECWVLRVADSDRTWFGLNWLRPAKDEPIGFGYILLSSILLGLPGFAVGAGLVYLAFGQVGPGVWLLLFIFVMIVELPLHFLFVHFWNRRAASLVQNA